MSFKHEFGDFMGISEWLQTPEGAANASVLIARITDARLEEYFKRNEEMAMTKGEDKALELAISSPEVMAVLAAVDEKGYVEFDGKRYELSPLGKAILDARNKKQACQ